MRRQRSVLTVTHQLRAVLSVNEPGCYLGGIYPGGLRFPNSNKRLPHPRSDRLLKAASPRLLRPPCLTTYFHDVEFNTEYGPPAQQPRSFRRHQHSRGGLLSLQLARRQGSVVWAMGRAWYARPFMQHLVCLDIFRLQGPRSLKIQSDLCKYTTVCMRLALEQIYTACASCARSTRRHPSFPLAMESISLVSRMQLFSPSLRLS